MSKINDDDDYSSGVSKFCPQTNHETRTAL